MYIEAIRQAFGHHIDYSQSGEDVRLGSGFFAGAAILASYDLHQREDGLHDRRS